MRAVAAYVQANGCVPCPTPAASVYTAGHGVVRGDTSASPAACGGTCSAAVGVVPFKSLGLAEGMARDGYNDWLTYAVDTALTVNFNVIPPTSPCQTGDTSPCSASDITNGTRKKGLCQSNILPNTNRITVTHYGGGAEKVAVLIMSHGANRRGAFTTKPTSGQRYAFPSGASCAGGYYEMCNADGDINFTAWLPTNDGNTPFDDLLVYLDRNALVTYLGGPACQTVW